MVFCGKPGGGGSCRNLTPSMLFTGIALMPVILGRFSALVTPKVQHVFWSVVEKPEAPTWSKLLRIANPGRSYTPLNPSSITALSLPPTIFLKVPKLNLGEQATEIP